MLLRKAFTDRREMVAKFFLQDQEWNSSKPAVTGAPQVYAEQLASVKVD